MSNAQLLRCRTEKVAITNVIFGKKKKKGAVSTSHLGGHLNHAVSRGWKKILTKRRRGEL